MPGVSADISLNVTAKLTATPDGSGSASARAAITRQMQLTPGNGALGAADLLFTDTRTLAASATENLDLAGVLLSPLGATITAAEVVGIIVEAAAGNTNSVVVGGAATNAFLGPFSIAADTVRVKPGQFVSFFDTDGWPVVATTADLLKIANSGAGTAVTYTVTIIGRSVVG